ncbi:hypothetical protein BU23DRAFT_240891 [Bimuria novae-zelandiae CBS 107.79]|uniref:Uncharacterized protein n=1 Tax=Bimuria novae-zelandiae CBS 107.79 TaxID=1447943 RepID=A0A6A5UXL9_9PLEO|nr:hypothetical protein BU23DRAFT_240891 [Bimuria novae-zelandiae CBS 107.79]
MAAVSHQNSAIDVTSIPEAPKAKIATPPSKVIKQYKPQGQWTLHRLASSSEFLCLQCNKRKKAKLIAIRHNQWDDLCCNACYGLKLSKAK